MMNQREIDEIIKLSQNENPLGACPKALKAVEEQCKSTMFRYPEPHSLSLKNAIGEKLGLSGDNIFVSSGLVEALDIAVRNFVGDGNLIIGRTTFVAYRLMAEVFGVDIHFAELVDFRMDVDEILKVYDDKTKMIIIANPNNPTGTMISHDDVIRLLNNVSKDTMVVLDEAYMEYVFDNNYPDTMSLQNEYPNLVVMRTFSKIYGLAGLRVGYVIANKETINRFEKYQAPFTVNNLAAVAVKAALKEDDFVKQSSEMNKEQREILYNGLVNLGFEAIPSQSNFIYINFPSIEERDAVYNHLESCKVFARKTDQFGGPTAFRITIGNPSDNKKVLACFKEFLAEV